MQARREGKVEASLLSREDKRGKAAPQTSGRLSSQKKGETPMLSLEAELTSVCSFHGKLLAWGNGGENLRD